MREPAPARAASVRAGMRARVPPFAWLCGGACLLASACASSQDVVGRFGFFGQPRRIELATPSGIPDAEWAETPREGPSVTADGLELYFRAGAAQRSDLYVSERASPCDPWGQPQAIRALNAKDFRDEAPGVTPDGLTLCFASNRHRPGGQRAAMRNTDLWRSARSSRADSWGSPKLMDGALLSDESERSPQLSSVGAEDRLVFARTPRVRDDLTRATLFVSRRAPGQSAWSRPEPVRGPQGQELRGNHGRLLGGGRTLVHVAKAAHKPSHDLWVRLRSDPDALFGPAQLSELLSSDLDEGSAWFVEDVHNTPTDVVFASTRAGGVHELYELHRTEPLSSWCETCPERCQ